MKLWASGKLDAAKIVLEITVFPRWATKYRTAHVGCLQKRDQLSPLQALALFVEAGLSRKYEIIRISDKKLYPSYTILQSAKRIAIQFLNLIMWQIHLLKSIYKILDHTTQLLLYLQEVVETWWQWLYIGTDKQVGMWWISTDTI